MSIRCTSAMAEPLSATNGSTAETQGNLLGDTQMETHRNALVKQKSSNDNTVAAAAVSSVNTGQDHKHDVVQGTETCEAVLAKKPNKVCAQEGEEQINTDKNQEPDLVHASCSTECQFENKVIAGVAIVGSPFSRNGVFINDKEKKPRRKGGKDRRKMKTLSGYLDEKKEKKKEGLQYTREEMEALRSVELDEQKKKWVEVYCRLGASVAQEYDALVDSVKVDQKDSVPSFDFDPRPQFQRTAVLGENSSEFAEDNSENLTNSDPAPCLPVGEEIDCSVMEEECGEDEDDSDEDYSSIQRPAFMVKGEPDFDSGPPQDGLEYLRRVRWEAARIPKVKVGKVNKMKEQSLYMPQIPGIMKCPENLLPLKKWEDIFLADFSELRQGFTQLDDVQGSSARTRIKLQSIDDEDLSRQLFEGIASHKLGNSTFRNDSSPSEDANVSQRCPENSSITNDHPTLSTILKMSAAARTSLLKRRIRSIENMSTLSYNECLWLFALCVVVDCPLDADTAAALRSLLRKCASLRAARTEVDDQVVLLNILVAISGRYFGQLENF